MGPRSRVRRRRNNHQSRSARGSSESPDIMSSFIDKSIQWIGASEKERNLLFFLQNYLQCGHIRVCKHNFLMFSVTSSKDFVTKIFPKLFTKTGKNLLKTSKRLCFQKFKKIVLLIREKQHLTVPGHEKILKLKLALNKNKILKNE